MSRTVLTLALLGGCGLPGFPEEHVLSVGGGEVALADGETRLSFRRVHAIQRLDGNYFVDDGLPYVSVGDAWLEITSSVTVANDGFVFHIEKTECATERVNCGDCSYDALASCTVEVDTSADSGPSSIGASSFVQEFSLADQYATTASETVGSNLIAVRSVGFYIGNFDLATRTVLAASASVDIITSFGVANLDLAAQPIIGHEQTVTIGPQQVRLTVLDIGNTSTRCDPLPVGCHNVFDLRLETAGLGAQTPRVLDYR